MSECKNCQRAFDGGCPYEDEEPPKNCKSYEKLKSGPVPNYIG